MNEFENKIIPTGDTKQWCMTVEDVAQGYGVDRTTIMKHLHNHADELREGIERGDTNMHTLGGPQQKTILYREGVIKLGFFIRSQQAKVFRQWATNLVLQHMDTTGMTIHDLFSQMSARFDRLDRVIHRQQDEIDELRAILSSVLSENEEEMLRQKIREVRDTLGMDGRALVGHLKKLLGCHTPYATVPLAINALNNMIGKGLTTIK
jgi:prophage antirepressor-like protein